MKSTVKNLGIATLLVVVPWISAPALCGAEGAVEHPNIILIMADDMGYGDSSVYDGWIKTPQMERMAREGLVFTDFHSSGVVCSPTRAGLVTGRYQQRAGVPGVINADPKMADHHRGLQRLEVTFAERLGAAGYQVGMFGKWHLGYDPKFNPLHHGFHEFRGFVSGNIDYISHYDRMEVYDWWHGLKKVQEPGYLTHLLTKHAVDFIARNKDRPFCLYVPHGAVHSPIQGPDNKPGRGPDKVKSAQQPQRPRDETTRLMMKALDENIGAILDALAEHQLEERTLVIFFSDNGGAAHMRCDPLRGRKGTVWEGGHRVPAIAWWPGQIKPGSRTDQLSISLDLMPTMLQLAGLPVEQDRKLDGVSLLPLLLEGTSLGRRQLFWNGVAMRDGPWKLVTRAKDLEGGPALFNLDEDIAETRNLAADHPQRLKQMLEALEAWKSDVATGQTSQPDFEHFRDSTDK
jgi:arylsulfatase A-like enzyme